MKPQPRPRLVLDPSSPSRVLHRSTCPAVRRYPRSFETRFADTSSRDVALAVADLNLHPCRACKPIRALAWWEHQQHKRAREDLR